MCYSKKPTDRDFVYELNDYEKILSYVTIAGLNVIGIAIVYLKDESVELDRELVLNGLGYLQRRHPFLRAFQEVDEESGSMRLVMPKDYRENAEKYKQMIQFEWHVSEDRKRSRDDMVRELEELSDIYFDYKKPGTFIWRFRAVDFYDSNDQRKYALALSIPIQVTDGINIACLNIELVNIINALSANRSCHEMEQELGISKSLHTMINEQNLLGDQQIKHLKELSAKKVEKSLLDPSLASSETGTKMFLFRIDASQTIRLLKLSKMHGVKLTSLLVAL